MATFQATFLLIGLNSPGDDWRKAAIIRRVLRLVHSYCAKGSAQGRQRWPVRVFSRLSSLQAFNVRSDLTGPPVLEVCYQSWHFDRSKREVCLDFTQYLIQAIA